MTSQDGDNMATCKTVFAEMLDAAFRARGFNVVEKTVEENFVRVAANVGGKSAYAVSSAREIEMNNSRDGLLAMCRHRIANAIATAEASA